MSCVLPLQLGSRMRQGGSSRTAGSRRRGGGWDHSFGGGSTGRIASLLWTILVRIQYMHQTAEKILTLCVEKLFSNALAEEQTDY